MKFVNFHLSRIFKLNTILKPCIDKLLLLVKSLSREFRLDKNMYTLCV